LPGQSIVSVPARPTWRAGFLYAETYEFAKAHEDAMGLLDDLKKLQADAADQVASVVDAEQLEQFRVKFLGVKGALKEAMTRLREVSKDEKPAVGKLANEVKLAIEAMFDQCKGRFAGPSGSGPQIDVTLPGSKPSIGRPHIITQTIDEVTAVFGRMGFDVAYGPEVEDEWHNFIALNIPASHPARDPLDNFYLTEDMLLRTQTSTIQIRTMEKQSPPVRVIAVGRVYRPDTVDATHSFMFHQVEGLYVDRDVTMADLKTTLDQFCKAYFGPEVEIRMRASFFPFTEPSAEVDMLFHLPDGSTRWIELGGCGMVDPNVLEAVHYDSEVYTGFAFGLGIERMVMRKHGIPDIRLLFENDLRFLQQF
jgi:phenylalanyl-tRNA synthetase alpha chain